MSSDDAAGGQAEPRAPSLAENDGVSARRMGPDGILVSFEGAAPQETSSCDRAAGEIGPFMRHGNAPGEALPDIATGSENHASRGNEGGTIRAFPGAQFAEAGKRVFDRRPVREASWNCGP